MRFDDSLTTVLSADLGPGMGAQTAWRQLVDLMGRGRAPTNDTTLERLARLRAIVPVAVRSASARALAFARPEPALVEFFAQDDLAVAAPVLRMVTLPVDAWLDLLGRLTPACRAVLRQRRDLPAEVERGLESFGAVDFVITDARPVAAVATADPEPPTAVAAPVAPIPDIDVWSVPDAPMDIPSIEPVPVATPMASEGMVPRFEIADLVARIDAFQRQRDDEPAEAMPSVPELQVESRERPEPGFRFETDANGQIRWVDGVSRAALIGVTLAHASRQGCAQVDASVAAAVRGRSRFTEGRLEVDGLSDAAGSWRVTGVPMFDPASGRFVGYRGVARLPYRHETAARSSASDQLRQLVHELRTPANAVAGFAELIESQLLGPVSDVYRARAAAIRSQAAGLLSAIDDLDTAARIEGRALDLRATIVPVRPLLERVVRDLTPLAAERGATLVIVGEGAVSADDRAVERLLARMLAALLSAARPGERIGVSVESDGARVQIVADRPDALADLTGDALFTLDGRVGEDEPGVPLLGAGFTLRLVRNLAVELGGALDILPGRLTVRLPAGEDRPADQVASH